MTAGIDLDAIRRRRGIDLTCWPPRYDPGYRPSPDDEHWLPEVECAHPEARDALILRKLQAQIESISASASSPRTATTSASSRR